MIPMLIQGMSYWDAYMLPIQVRKYMISRYLEISNQVKQTEKKDPAMKSIAKKTRLSSPEPNHLGKPQR